MKKYAQALPIIMVLAGLLFADSSKLSAQIVVHVPIGRFIHPADRFYPPAPMYRPGARFDYLAWKYGNRRNSRRHYYEDSRDYYEDRRDRYEDRRDYYEDRRDRYEDRRDSYDDRRDYYEDRRDRYEDRRDDYEDRRDREERVQYDTRPRYDNYEEENRNETLFKEYSAEGQFIRRIPKNAERFKMGGKPFYMHEGVFYKPQKRGYVIIPPPIGMRVKFVPRGARHLQIDGLDYYEINGTYYLDIPRKRYYEIVPEPVHETRKYPNQPQAKDYRRSRRN
ncbi:MAG: DUF6515 family protein [Bacteroidota bacterium]